MFKKLLLPLLVGLTLWMPASPAFAKTTTATAQALMQKSGLWQQFEGIAEQIHAGFLQALAQHGIKPSAAELERLSRTIDLAYAPAHLRSAALGVMTQTVDAKHVKAITAWYESAVGKTITELEDSATAEPPNADQMAALLNALAEPRRALLTELVSVTNYAQTMTSMTINTALAIQQGVASATPEDRGLSTQEMRQALEAQRPQMLQTFTAASLALCLKIYAPLSDQQLTAYVGFLQSKAGQHFTEVSLQALETALVDAAKQWGRNLPSIKDDANI